MTTDPNEIPRRARVDQMSAGELAIRQAVAEVEGMGADHRLTEAVILLDRAKNAIADYVDGVDYTTPDDVQLAARGYNAYGAKAGWTTYDGKPMPTWDKLGEVVQGRWIEATREIRTALGGR